MIHRALTTFNTITFREKIALNFSFHLDESYFSLLLGLLDLFSVCLLGLLDLVSVCLPLDFITAELHQRIFDRFYSSEDENPNHAVPKARFCKEIQICPNQTFQSGPHVGTGNKMPSSRLEHQPIG